MPEIIADHISIVETSELERFSRVDAEYYHPINSKHILEQYLGYKNFERTDEQNRTLQIPLLRGVRGVFIQNVTKM
ncbi:MAG: hypothetical protein NG747_14800 [Candidatus Brocadia sp.]|nr:hypothetical protein [Candidatus Brocadia sp.]